MFIFYDFETSSRHLIGQIISYAFVVTDKQLNVVQNLQGKIKLNRTQCPEVDALLVNKIYVDDLQKNGQTEYAAAKDIFNFLTKMITDYGDCHLVGFNSNQFDIGFLRTLLLRYGINPYFEGKLKNCDILHFSQYLAFYYPDKFPWVQTQSDNSSYYSFRLEELTSACGLLTEAQSHDALEDVLLTIKLVTYFEETFGESLANFNPCQLTINQENQTKWPLFQCKTRHFASVGEDPQKFSYEYYAGLSLSKKSNLLISLTKYHELSHNQEHLTEADKLSCIRYVNPNKAFLIAEPMAAEQLHSWQQTQACIEDDPFFNKLKQNPGTYFEYIKKDWDIEYQIHELGFERIPELHNITESFMNDPSQYEPILAELLKKRQHIKDNYVIQLFNRTYLNYHPNPNPEYLKRYLAPRYVSGTMYKEEGHDNLFEKEYAYLIEKLDSVDNETDLGILKSLLGYFEEFTELMH
ncbi:hypothetical protein DID76_00010 [Candidatus Marinamargulisbacteria bacterium SCGC AG-414-C22]|nr:hypothetical protein DID76_00010 [Candidatus Marinamargulisbacteria bacterium SCGC AG-414-C22]